MQSPLRKNAELPHLQLWKCHNFFLHLSEYITMFLRLLFHKSNMTLKKAVMIWTSVAVSTTVVWVFSRRVKGGKVLCDHPQSNWSPVDRLITDCLLPHVPIIVTLCCLPASSTDNQYTSTSLSSLFDISIYLRICTWNNTSCGFNTPEDNVLTICLTPYLIGYGLTKKK